MNILTKTGATVSQCHHFFVSKDQKTVEKKRECSESLQFLLLCRTLNTVLEACPQRASNRSIWSKSLLNRVSIGLSLNISLFQMI